MSVIRIFQYREIREATAYSLEGGQALHMMPGTVAYGRRDTPSCFKGRREIAHLLDQDRARLIKTARRFGVRVIKVEHEGDQWQHIDLCGKPLDRAVEEASQAESEAQRGLFEVPQPSTLNPQLPS